MAHKSKFLSSIFRHLDGLVTAPVAIAFKNKSVLEFILNKEKLTLSELTVAFNANEGYLNVGLRVLASQGFLDYEVDNQTQEITISVNEKTEMAFSLFHLYEDVVDLLHLSIQFHPRLFEDVPFEKLNLIFEKYKTRYGIEPSADLLRSSIQRQILKHIEGHLIGPTIVRLAMNGMFHKYFMETSFRPEEFHKSPENFKKILDFFVHLAGLSKKTAIISLPKLVCFLPKEPALTALRFPIYQHLPKLKN